MHKFAFLLVCLTCASHAKRVRPFVENSHGASRAGSSSPFAVDPAAAFNTPSIQRGFSVNTQAPIHGVSKPATFDTQRQSEGRIRNPIMSPEAVEEQVDSVSTEESEESENDDKESLSPAEQYRKEKKITLKGKDALQEKHNPFYSFDDTPYDPLVKDLFTDMGYLEPSAIQAQAWPIVLNGRDIIAIARTGSGKTVGFLMPALHQLMTRTGKFAQAGNLKQVGPNAFLAKFVLPDKSTGRVIGKGGSNIRGIREATDCNIKLPERDSGSNVCEVTGTEDKVPIAVQMIKDAAALAHAPKVLVLAPTRELATQIVEEAQRYTPATGIWSLCIYGGANKWDQINELQTTRPEVVVATPGRAKDLIQMGKLDLSEVRYVVLDEADRMLDMGFGPDMTHLMKFLPKDRQTLMFSATWPDEVKRLAKTFLSSEVQVRIGDGNTLNANKKIKQNFEFINSESTKYKQMFKTLESINPDEQKDPLNVPKTIIFVSRKTVCDEIADTIFESGYAVDSLHGDHEQDRREAVMDGFREGSIRVLVATDVAARGLDVKDITAVINFDMPTASNGAEDYVHRIGRTGRGNNDGLAFSFFSDKDSKLAPDLIGILERAGQEVPVKLQTFGKRNFGGKKKKPKREVARKTKEPEGSAPPKKKAPEIPQYGQDADFLEQLGLDSGGFGKQKDFGADEDLGRQPSIFGSANAASDRPGLFDELRSIGTDGDFDDFGKTTKKPKDLFETDSQFDDFGKKQKAFGSWGAFTGPAGGVDDDDLTSLGASTSSSTSRSFDKFDDDLSGLGGAAGGGSSRDFGDVGDDLSSLGGAAGKASRSPSRSRDFGDVDDDLSSLGGAASGASRSPSRSSSFDEEGDDLDLASLGASISQASQTDTRTWRQRTGIGMKGDPASWGAGFAGAQSQPQAFNQRNRFQSKFGNEERMPNFKNFGANFRPEGEDLGGSAPRRDSRFTGGVDSFRRRALLEDSRRNGASPLHGRRNALEQAGFQSRFARPPAGGQEFGGRPRRFSQSSFGGRPLPERYGGSGAPGGSVGGEWKKDGGNTGADGKRLPPPDLDSIFEKLLQESRQGSE